MLAISLKNSYFLLSLFKLRDMGNRVKIYLLRMYSNSFTNKLIKAFWDGAKINFKYSFIVRISDINSCDYTFILKNSKFANWLFALYKTSKLLIIDYKLTSAIVASVLIIKKELNSFSVKTGSIIMGTCLFANVFLSILLGKKIAALQWFMQSLIFFISLGIIVSGSKWKDLKGESAVISYINRYCKI